MPHQLTCALHAAQVAGIIAGQLSLGFLADRIGRKWGSVITAALMLVGGILILASAGPTPSKIFLMYTICQVGNSFLSPPCVYTLSIYHCVCLHNAEPYLNKPRLRLIVRCINMCILQ